MKAYDHAVSYRTGPVDLRTAEQWAGGASGFTDPDDKRLSFKGLGRKAADQIVTKASGDSKAAPALAPSGATVVAQDFEPSVVALGQPAQSLLDVLPVKPHDTALFAY